MSKYKEVTASQIAFANISSINKAMQNANYYKSTEYYNDLILFNIGTRTQESVMQLYILFLLEEIQQKWGTKNILLRQNGNR